MLPDREMARWGLALALLCGVTSGISCGPSDRVALVPVKGKITVQGQPAEGAAIMLVPVDDSGLRKLLRPRAKCDEQGAFTLFTYEEGDGAPPGEYRVSIVWRGPSPEYAGGEVPHEERHSGPDRLGEKYDDPAKSGLTATIGTGATELPPFALP